jgi:hypothetical protein
VAINSLGFDSFSSETEAAAAAAASAVDTGSWTGSDAAAVEDAADAGGGGFSDSEVAVKGSGTHVLGCSVDVSGSNGGYRSSWTRGGGGGGPSAALLAWRNDAGAAAGPAGTWGEVEEELIRGLAAVARSALAANSRAAGTRGASSQAVSSSGDQAKMRRHLSWQPGDSAALAAHASGHGESAASDAWIL